MNQVPFDETDPMVAVFAWLFTLALGRMFDALKWDAYKGVLPVAAVVLAAGLRVGIDAAAGSPLSVETALRGLAAGGVAVLSHSQLREVVKFVGEKEEKS